MPGNLKKFHRRNLIGAAGKIIDIVGGGKIRVGAALVRRSLSCYD